MKRKMKIDSLLANKSQEFRLVFSPAWGRKKRHFFTIRSGNTTLRLGGKEARMLHDFLRKVY